MEHLTSPRRYESSFERVLEAQNLLDLTQFDRAGYFDELPLYSHVAQLSFLDALDRDEADAVLLGLGLDYLDRVLTYAVPRVPFLAALTCFDFGKNEPLVPAIFVCHGSVDDRLGRRLVLRTPRSAFGARVSDLLESLGGGEHHQIGEDMQTVLRKARIFLGPKTLTKPHLVGIDHFVTGK